MIYEYYFFFIGGEEQKEFSLKMICCKFLIFNRNKIYVFFDFKKYVLNRYINKYFFLM